MVEEAEGVELWEVAGGGPPAPAEEIEGVGLAGGDAVPALEDLLAGAVVARGEGGRVTDPGAGGVVAAAAGLRGCGVRPGNGGGSESGEEEEE